MSKILIIKGIKNCKQCPYFEMSNDGKVTEPVCNKLGDYLNKGYESRTPVECPLPNDQTPETD